ncbi:hypothetical protein NEOLEDRAFT_277398 [Neolentinus lepideus HHB14362 ss-1]|uniref:Uncharacterized protein n=1 Tax=Neolentinus lepideus HHB14362 ss-1 TaxID=1314782 RepID=A0A165SXY8_9AGAM|nr:hypothetical protein NEOLEDRAFT_277398 [Neolentinus lepideus HHB14362 ss-1]
MHRRRRDRITHIPLRQGQYRRRRPPRCVQSKNAAPGDRLVWRARGGKLVAGDVVSAVIPLRSLPLEDVRGFQMPDLDAPVTSIVAEMEVLVKRAEASEGRVKERGRGALLSISLHEVWEGMIRNYTHQSYYAIPFPAGAIAERSDRSQTRILDDLLRSILIALYSSSAILPIHNSIAALFAPMVPEIILVRLQQSSRYSSPVEHRNQIKAPVGRAVNTNEIYL